MPSTNEYDVRPHGSHDVSDEEYRQMRAAEDDDYKPPREKKSSTAKKAESDIDDGYIYPDPTTIDPKTKRHITDNLLRQRGFDQLHNTNFGKGTSNEELMLEHEYVEIYDCGQLVFVMEDKNY